jgi:hypothetical protein
MSRFTRNARQALVLAMLTAPAHGGGSLVLANQSGETWCLRVGAQPGATLLVQGSQDQGTTELGPGHQGAAYCLQPGATCTLAFKDGPGQPLTTKLELVDGTGQGGGLLVLASRPRSLGQEVRTCFDGPEGKDAPSCPLTVAPSSPAATPENEEEDPWVARRVSGWGGDWY